MTLALALACSQAGPAPATPAKSSAGTTATTSEPGLPATGAQGPLPAPGTDAPASAPVKGYDVVRRLPHDPKAYTQGLFIQDGELFESTGRHGTSSVRIVDLETGTVKRKTDLGSEFFGEGSAPYKGLLVMLTWQENTALVFDRQRLKEQYRYTYEGEGWGLTFDGEHFWMSDGTPELRVLDPNGFKELRRVTVTDGGQKVFKLNELEWIEGELWANVWQTDRIARIDPATGKVKSWLDLTGILGSHRVADPTDEVLNGIAWDSAQKKVYVTGKHWPWLFEIKARD
ncbi:MAG: glutaminyl-peptide cyclotransferase [Planctomycetota bacterium]